MHLTKIQEILECDLQQQVQLPDLNLTENLWLGLKEMLEACKPSKSEEMTNTFQDEWAKIPGKCCKKLVSYYASCLHKIITAK